MSTRPALSLPIGFRSGYLEVNGEATQKRGKRAYPCYCHRCGNTTVVRVYKLATKTTRSCGCLAKDNLLRCGSKRHGVHGMRRDPIHGIWCRVRQICNNPKHAGYPQCGGRGIKVCEEWNVFLKFHEWAKVSGYKAGLSLVRINDDRDYSPDNCRWEPHKRKAVTLTAFGETKNVHQWSLDPRCQVKNSSSLYVRVKKKGWTAEAAISTPPTKSRRPLDQPGRDEVAAELVDQPNDTGEVVIDG